MYNNYPSGYYYAEDRVRQNPRGRGRGRGCFGRSNPARRYEEPVARFEPAQAKQYPPKTKTAIPKEVVSVRPTPPTPQHLSKVPYKEAVFPEVCEEFRATSSEFNYYAEVGGYVELVNQVYEAYASQNPSFAKRITPSGFLYYSSSLLWARMLLLQRGNNYETDYDDQRYIETIQRGDYLIPSPLQLFLDGLGNTTMPEGKDILFRLKTFETMDVDSEIGWLGEIVPENLMLYTAYPCLAALMKRMQQDLIVTNDAAAARDWLPPDGIHNPDGNALNQHFFGYQPGMKLSGEQTRELHNMGFTHDVYPQIDNGKYMLSTILLNHVNAHLRDTTLFEFSSLSDKSAKVGRRTLFKI